MSQVLGTSWGRNVFAALLAAILFAVLGLILGTPPPVTLFAAAIFGTLLVLIVQIGLVVSILASARRSPPDIGGVMLAEVETPAGQQELKRMSFISLMSVAVVQELYVTLFKRDRPVWAFEFLGVAEGQFAPHDYGWFNRYLEWMLMILLGAFSIITAMLFAWFAYALASPRDAQSFSALGLMLGLLAFIVGLGVALPVGLYIVSVIRRLFILYAARAEPAMIK